MSKFYLIMFLAFNFLGACASTKSSLSEKSVSVNRQVLVILSGKDYVITKEGVRHPTGYFLSELAEASIALTKAGYKLTFATPGGVLPVMDVTSNDVKWFKSAEQFEEAKAFVSYPNRLSNPSVLENLTTSDLNTYAAVVVPGGHAPMEDLYRSDAMGRVLQYFHKYKKPTGLICHGPVALLSAKKNGTWIYSGYKMTGFSTAEEKQEEDAGHLDGHMKFYLDEALQQAGGILAVGAPWSATAIRDRELITGQNPMSAEPFINLLLEALSESEILKKGIQKFSSDQALPMNQFVIVDRPTSNKSDWNSGYKTLWIGTAKNSVEEFDRKISSHVRLTSKSFASKGLKEYLVFTGPGHEIAYMLWSSKQAADEAFATEAGQAVISDSGLFMNQVIFKEVDHNPFAY